MSEKITGAEALIKSLIAEGVDRVFGYPGGAIIPVYDKLYDYTDQLKHILVRHEQGATHAAQGYARVSGRTGVVIVTSGPAATNVITGLSDALMDSTPMVVITGQVASAFLGSDAFQETDVVGITQPITKWAYQIRRAEDIPWAVARAFYIAGTGRPGPVVLDIAKDAQTGLLEWSHKKCEFIRSYIPYPEVKQDDLQVVADLINAAERPMIISGHGVMISEAEKELAALAEKADIPVTATLLGLSTIPSSHPLYKGMLGMHGNIGPNVNTNRCDLLVAVGMRFDDRVTGDTSKYAKQAKIVHIDIDSSEFDKNVKTTATVHGDAKEVLARLLPLVNEAKHTEWLQTFDEMALVEQEKVVKREVFPESGLMNMGEVVHKVSKATGDKAVLITDVGQNQMFSSRYFRYTEPKSIITSGGLGTMGFGLPASIGAKMGAPERTVCFFTGDGGLQMTIQELGTIMEYGVAVKIILLNNNFLGNVRQWQELFFKGRFSQTPMVNPDFVQIADAYGIKAENVETREQLDGAIERMLAHDGAYLLNVNIDATDMIFPMTPAGAAVDDIMLTPDEKFKLD
ncbi:MAG: biosynthetic-type acetolactate synthase large subunit [Muribaculaceae bacterium]|nr:biosynthetic-type acetolactate synthase large subunit [Muribaculaceae bacterium]